MEEALMAVMLQGKEAAEETQAATRWRGEAEEETREERAARLRGRARAAARALSRSPPDQGSWRPEFLPHGPQEIWVGEEERVRKTRRAQVRGIRRAEQEAAARMTQQYATAKARLREWRKEQAAQVRDGLLTEVDPDDIDKRYREVCRLMKRGGVDHAPLALGEGMPRTGRSSHTHPRRCLRREGASWTK